MPPREPLPGSAAAAARTPCVVPHLKGKPLDRARQRVRSAGCRIGRVRRQRGTASRQDRVVLQSPAPDTSLPPWGAVTVNLGG
jgi:beta-lactam-binding protein with PASTA domain